MQWLQTQIGKHFICWNTSAQMYIVYFILSFPSAVHLPINDYCCLWWPVKDMQNLLNPHMSLRWRHNERDNVSNQQPCDCLLNRLFTRRSKKTSKLRVTGLCAGNSPETGEFPAQRSSNAENGSLWWRHHVIATVTTANFSQFLLLAGIPTHMISFRTADLKTHYC